MAEIRVPTLGKSVTEATIGKWFKKPGDAIAVDEPLVELETDKVTIEVPAPVAGVLGDIAAKDGDTVAVGALLGQIKEGWARPPPPRLNAKWKRRQKLRRLPRRSRRQPNRRHLHPPRHRRRTCRSPRPSANSRPVQHGRDHRARHG